jgi:hypothetical protein
MDLIARSCAGHGPTPASRAEGRRFALAKFALARRLASAPAQIACRHQRDASARGSSVMAAGSTPWLASLDVWLPVPAEICSALRIARTTASGDRDGVAFYRPAGRRFRRRYRRSDGGRCACRSFRAGRRVGTRRAAAGRSPPGWNAAVEAHPRTRGSPPAPIAQPVTPPTQASMHQPFSATHVPWRARLP